MVAAVSGPAHMDAPNLITARRVCAVMIGLMALTTRPSGGGTRPHLSL
jgi:hypothetical protein